MVSFSWRAFRCLLVTFHVPFYFDEGLGILSRWPVVWSDAQSLPHLDLVLFTREVLGARVTGNLIDAWTAVNPDDEGFTIPSNRPNRRIDYV